MKKISKLLLIGLSVLSLSSCGQIEDTNGADDYSIVTISDERIISGSSYSMMGSVSSHKTTNTYSKGTFKCSKFSGVHEINSFTTKSNQLKYTIDFKVESGNCVLAIISDDEIIKKVEANTDTTFTLPYSSKQKLKVVGESAKFELEYYVS